MGALSGARILVTGASGFIGTHLVNRLRGEGLLRLVLLSRHPNGALHPGEVAIASDLADVGAATWRDAAVDEFDIVYHLGAATVTSRTSGPSRADVVRSNVIGTQRLLDSLQTMQCRFVFASTVDVFAPCEGFIDELSPLGARDPFPASKLMGEALVSDWAHQTRCSTVIARVGHVYGPGEEASGKAIPTFIRAALEGRPLVVYGDGSTVRDLLYVTDAVEALVRTATAVLTEQPTVMILAGSSSCMVGEIAHQIAEIAGRPELVRFDRDRDAGHSTRFNTGRMQRLIGDWRQVSLRDGLRSEVEFSRESPSPT